MRTEGHAVESILRVLHQQGLAIAARTYRAWKNPASIAARTVTDALVEDKIRDLAWTINPATGQVQMTPEGLYGRKKWAALLRRQDGLAGTSRGAVDRAMRTLGLKGIRRVKKVRTTIPGPDGKRADDLLNRDFTAPAPNRVWVTDFTYVRTWAGFVYVAFVVDVFAQRIVGWHASTSKKVDLVMTPMRIALWQREREGNPISPGDLIHHSDAGTQVTEVRARPEPSSPHRIDGPGRRCRRSTPRWNPSSRYCRRTFWTASAGGPEKSSGSRSSPGSRGPITDAAARPAWAD